MKCTVKPIRVIAFLGTALVAQAAVAADLPSKKAPIIEAPAPDFSWEGFYLGAFAGAALGDGAFTYLRQTPLRGAAFVGGGAIGYNWQWTPKVVLGVEADFGYRGPVQSESVAWNYANPASAGVLGTLRARAGYAFTPRWLAYASGGLAYGTDFTPRGFSSALPLTFGQKSTGQNLRPGWTAGGGIEYAWSDKISIKGEYLYARLADSGVDYSTNFGTASLNVRSAAHIVRGGINYHFATNGASATPVLAK